MKDFLKKAKGNPQFIVLSILAGGLIAAAVFAPWLAPHDPIANDYGNSMKAPGLHFLFGTDALGRCVFSRCLWGGRTSLLIVFLVVAIVSLAGILLGVAAGFFGGWLDCLITRATDVAMAIPTTVFVIALVSILGPGLLNTTLAMSLVGWTEYCRVSRALVLSVKQECHIKEAILGGLSRRAMIFHNVLPNIVPYLLVNITQDIGSNLLTLSGLSVLGLASQPPTPEWGYMLSEGRKYIQSAPWLIIWPGLVIVVHVIIFNLLGDSLRDILDPRFERAKKERRYVKKWLKKS